MRYRDPFEFEESDLAAQAPPQPQDTVMSDATAPEDAPTASMDQSDGGVPSAARDAPNGDASARARSPEPPLWSTADDHVLHLPPDTLERIILAVPWLRRFWRPAPRPGPQPRPRGQAIRAVGQLVRRASRIGTRGTRAGSVPVFRSRAGGRNFRIVARPRAGLRHEILSIEPELGDLEGELEQRPQGAPTKIQARILWPALGFPAVVTPNARASKDAMRDGDATTCVCLLVLSDHPSLSSAHAAQYLRYVSWDTRGRRHIRNNPASSFPASEITVVRRAPVEGRKDGFGQHLRFGHNGRNQNGITACLSNYVTAFYSRPGLKYLYEIRISETKTASLQQGQYQLFWNNELTNESLPSDEMAMLLGQFARPRRARSAKAQELDYLVSEYRYEYGGLHPPYNQSSSRQVPAEILHPLFIERHRDVALRIGHVTDTHVDVRADVYEHNLVAASLKARADLKTPGRIPKDQLEFTKCLANRRDGYNNFNTSFTATYAEAKVNSDVLLLTGDLIDYGRGHWGIAKPGAVQVDGLYHADRNWFLFYYLLASGKNYNKPAYTILGNHDWRINPYPPFAPGAPNPNELLHNHANLTKAQQKQFVATAHGPGHKRGFSYTSEAESAWQLVKSQDLATTASSMVKFFAQSSNVEVKGFPIETNVESIAWYLLSINPFLDYTFTLPGKQSVLMLDWAKDEDVLFPQVQNGEKRGYNPLSPGDAAGTPRPRNNLTEMQQHLVNDFIAGPSRAKIVGIHAPVVGPYWDWFDSDLLKAHKTYRNPDSARGPAAGHPTFATTPSTASGTPFGMVADRGALGREKVRDSFIRKLADPSYSVRMVFSGHIHRNVLLVTHPPQQKVEITNPKDRFRSRVVTGGLIVRRVLEQAVTGARSPAVTIDRMFRSDETRRGPLYIATTSAGPRGTFEERELTPDEKKTGKTTDPGYARAELASDGTIKSVRFFKTDLTKARTISAPVGAPRTAARAAREVEEMVAGTW